MIVAVLKTCLGAAVLLMVTGAAAGAASDREGDVLYQRCAACHLEDGAGVPGAFPPLRRHLREMALRPVGRDYLALVLRFGLHGRITAEGTPYFGAMPAQYPALDEASMADVLNYVLETLNDAAQDPAWKRFDSQEIIDILSRYPKNDNQQILNLRQQAVAPHAPQRHDDRD